MDSDTRSAAFSHQCSVLQVDGRLGGVHAAALAQQRLSPCRHATCESRNSFAGGSTDMQYRQASVRGAGDSSLQQYPRVLSMLLMY